MHEMKIPSRLSPAVRTRRLLD